jgi:hypothetical protein
VSPGSDLPELKASLLRDLGVELRSDQGDQAFERHQLLAIRFNRAARLNRRKSDQRDGTIWNRYFDEHFPRGVEHADLLWNEWRVPLLKDETPGKGVAISHGQPELHWQIMSGGLYLNLESLWDDYAASVEHFIAMLDTNTERREIALERWEKLRWAVQMVSVEPSDASLLEPNVYTASAASVSTSASILKHT